MDINLPLLFWLTIIILAVAIWSKIPKIKLWIVNYLDRLANSEIDKINEEVFRIAKPDLAPSSLVLIVNGRMLPHKEVTYDSSNHTIIFRTPLEKGDLFEISLDGNRVYKETITSQTKSLVIE